MLPATMHAGFREAKKFDPIPADMYQVELLDITAQRVETYDHKQGKEGAEQYEDIYNFQFVLLNGQRNGKSLRGLSAWSNFVPSYLYYGKKNGKNKLWKIVESLIGRDLTMDEYTAGLTGAFFNSLIGKQCRILIEQKKNKDGDVFSNPTSWLPVTELYNALTADEKEKARPKKNKGEHLTDEPQGKMIEPGDPNYVSPEDIPF